MKGNICTYFMLDDKIVNQNYLYQLPVEGQEVIYFKRSYRVKKVVFDLDGDNHIVHLERIEAA